VSAALRAIPLDLYTIRPDLVAALDSWDRPDDVLVEATIFVHHPDGALVDAVLAGEIASARVINQATEEVVLVIREDDGVLVGAVDDIATA
jgi:hypothetical protein